MRTGSNSRSTSRIGPKPRPDLRLFDSPTASRAGGFFVGVYPTRARPTLMNYSTQALLGWSFWLTAGEYQPCSRGSSCPVLVFPPCAFVLHAQERPGGVLVTSEPHPARALIHALGLRAPSPPTKRRLRRRLEGALGRGFGSLVLAQSSPRRKSRYCTGDSSNAFEARNVAMSASRSS